MSRARIPTDPRKRSERVRWLRLTDRFITVTVASRPAWFYGHWDGTRRRSMRCEGEGCSLCEDGATLLLYVYLWVIDEADLLHMWEVPLSQRDTVDQLDASADGIVGRVLYLGKNGPARNSRIIVQVVDKVETVELDAWPLVSTLGVWDRSASSRPSNGASSGLPEKPQKVATGGDFSDTPRRLGEILDELRE